MDDADISCEDGEIGEKHSAILHEKSHYLDEQAEKLYEKMMFYLECDFNLLVYGVGTTKNWINAFVVN